ncbi:MAG TPA: carbohydrate binding domain-containing protein [Terriglobales bacterium]|nr:carbohydrate binding domain-containing protein [Terriglobales bacterium]
MGPHQARIHSHENSGLQISLQSPARKIIFLSACLALTGLYIGLAASEFLADYFSKKLDLASLQRAAHLRPENAEYQYRIGHYFLETQREPAAAAQFFKSATALNPYNAGYWLALSRTYRRLADGDRQKDALQRAIAADPSAPGVAWEAANFYWTMGETDKALREFHVVLENDPYLPPDALDRCWRIKPDVEALLRDVVPRNAEVYSSFLDFLISRNEPGAAARVWSEMVKFQHPVETQHVFNYVRYLVDRRDVAHARQAWQQAASLSELTGYQASSENLVVNGDFSLPVLNGGFDWQYEKSSDVSLALDATELHSGQRSLSIVFDSRGIDDVGIRQLIPVEPNTTYEFSAYFKSQGLVGAGGPRFLLVDRFTGANYFASDELRDADFWKQVTGTFDTGPDTKLLVLRIQRVPAGDAIRGKLWIGGVHLAQRHLVREQTTAGGQ